MLLNKENTKKCNNRKEIKSFVIEKNGRSEYE